MGFEELEKELRAALSRGRSPQEHVSQYVELLEIVAAHLKSAGVAQAIVNEFQVLAAALDDLKTGVVAPFLRHAKVGNRADATEVWIARALVAIAIDVLIGDGMSAREASSVVADKASSLSSSLGGGDFGARARRWHTMLKSGRAKSDGAREIFSSRRELVDAEREALGDDADAISSVILLYALIQFASALRVDAKQLLGRFTI